MNVLQCSPTPSRRPRSIRPSHPAPNGATGEQSKPPLSAALAPRRTGPKSSPSILVSAVSVEPIQHRTSGSSRLLHSENYSNKGLICVGFRVRGPREAIGGLLYAIALLSLDSVPTKEEP